LVVFADSKEIYRERIRGMDEPKQVDLDIKGSQKITLQVEAGEGLDLGDHANWCEARFYQSTAK
jgi:NPCBM/NEW2 domain